MNNGFLSKLQFNGMQYVDVELADIELDSLSPFILQVKLLAV